MNYLTSIADAVEKLVISILSTTVINHIKISCLFIDSTVANISVHNITVSRFRDYVLGTMFVTLGIM